MSEGVSVPLGTVLAYAGSLTGPQLNALGWAFCDGSKMDVSGHNDLYQVLGTSNGGDGSTYFNLPDYQGFFLRGVDPTRTVDPDAASRTAATSGGASGDNVGSIQEWATHNSQGGFKGSVDHVPNDWHHAYASSDCSMLIDGTVTVSSDAGGDTESRPINAYVFYIIKILSTAAIPTGAVVPYAGSATTGSRNLARYYSLCDGTELPQGEFPDLFAAIKTAHGGDATAFNLPDYRGRFLRGVTGDTENDPDAASRTAMNTGGNTANNVGSIQSWATGRPKTPFTMALRVGDTRADSSVCAGHDNSVWNDGNGTGTVTGSGGDNETRPVNVNVDFFILNAKDPGTEDIFPIGGIIGIPGNGAPPTGQWLLCNGSTLQNSQQYEELYYAIHHDNGGDATSYDLPDLQGQFMRGCDHGENRDPDSTKRKAAKDGGQTGDNVGSVQAWATGSPHTPITASVPHLPSSDHDTAAALGGNHVANWGGTVSPDVNGGDKETRPLNAYIKFYIKYAPAT